MANANQVIVNGETILDLRSDTVTPETLQKGYTAHDKSGKKITGTLEAPSLQSKSVTYTSNGTATVTPDAGYDGLSSVDVTVDVIGGEGILGIKTGTIYSKKYMSAPGVYTYTFDLSPITMLDDRFMIMLCGTVPSSYSSILCVLTRTSTSDNFTVYYGGGIGGCMDSNVSIPNATLILVDAILNHDDLETPTYYAI